jgi:murein DD-endopeptidase MepM/ murein hydrolase activator NlpD
MDFPSLLLARLSMVSLWLVFPVLLRAQPGLPAGPSPVPVDIQVPVPPLPVQALGQAHLVYELHITNLSPGGLRLTGVEVRGNEPPAPALATYRGAELEQRLLVLQFSAEKQPKQVLGGGQRAIVFMLLSIDPARAPGTLQHRFYFKSAPAADSAQAEQVVEYSGVPVQQGRPVVLSPPLRGRWLAANGLSNDTGHRRSVTAVEGRARIAQRYATDWVKVGEDGLLARRGDLSQNVNYYGYGAPALAVANATVVAIKDGLPENVPQVKQRAVAITPETIAGNYVVLDLGQGLFALYAHLQPQSLQVKVGDKVKTGQLLGLVGNSGNSHLPHLHFQVANAPLALGAEGVPYVLRSFGQQGIAGASAELVKGGFRPAAGAETTRKAELPVQNAVVVFP